MKKWMFMAAAAVCGLIGGAQPSFAQPVEIHFPLAVNPKFLNCLRVPGGPTPTAQVTVLRGKQNDLLVLKVRGLRPNPAFDVFTVEKSQFLANGSPDPAFSNFGLAWYQSDLQADSSGEAEIQIQSIFLDQIFGFDPSSSLPPTNTFHLGFWFNRPIDAAACGFDVSKPTPFNGEHRAGPMAMMSLPNAVTGLGPLCSNPGPGGTCHP